MRVKSVSGARAWARAPLEVPEEARVRRVRVVHDRRRRARLVRHEEVHLEPVQPRRELRVVPVLVLALLFIVLVEHHEVVPVLGERRLHGARVVGGLTDVATDVGEAIA